VQEVLNYVSAFRILVVKKFRVKLNSVESTAFLLHRLDLTGFVGSCSSEAFWQFLYLITVVMPNGNLGWQSFEKPFASVLNWKKATFSLSSFIAFAGFETPHQSNPGTIREGDLLMASTYA